MPWKVELTELARKALKELLDTRVRQALIKQMESLQTEPEKQGKPLLGEFKGVRSLRAVGQRYRILYSLDQQRRVVYVLLVGIRKEGDKKDVYALARKLLKSRLL